MGAPTTKTIGCGTIDAIRKVWIDATSTQFAMVTPDEGFRSRLAIRIGPNTTADGSNCFFVGDKVQYTVLTDAAGQFQTAQNLVKFR